MHDVNSIEREHLTKMFQNNQFSSEITCFPVADHDASIVRDLLLIGYHYPVYRDYILLSLYNEKTRQEYLDVDNKNAGPWYGILCMIARTHANTLCRNHLPRGRFQITEQRNTQQLIPSDFPTWNWEVVTRKIMEDIVFLHYRDWYYNFCKPKMENAEESFGKFFAALEMLLDYIAHLVEEKINCLMISYVSNKEHNNNTQTALHVLNQHGDNEHPRMMWRFHNNNWNIERYDPDHIDYI
jgi:hypothetical protein